MCHPSAPLSGCPLSSTYPTKGRRLGLPQLHRILLLLLRRLRALRPGLPRPPRPQVLQRPQGLLQEGHRSPVEHVLGTSRVMWSIMDVLPPAALRQASCRNGSGGRGAETIYSNNGPRVIRGALDFQFQCVTRFFPFANLRSRHTDRRAPTHARPTAFVYDRRRTSLALQEQARPSKPSAPPSEQAHHPAAHASPHGAPQLSHVQMCTQLTLPAFSAPAAVLLRPRRAGHTRLPQTPCR